MMENVLSIATLLGGITSLWFLWDKRRIIVSFIKIISKNNVNPLSLSDDSFLFFMSARNNFLAGPYIPENEKENALCKSLANAGILTKHDDRYSLTAAGKLMART